MLGNDISKANLLHGFELAHLGRSSAAPLHVCGPQKEIGMSMWRFFRRRGEDEELVRELEAHVAHEVDENVARGMTEMEARRLARLKFGSAVSVRENVWEWNSIETLEN